MQKSLKIRSGLWEPVIWRTENTMSKIKRTNGQTLQRMLNIAERLTVPVLLVTNIILLLNRTRIIWYRNLVLDRIVQVCSRILFWELTSVIIDAILCFMFLSATYLYHETIFNLIKFILRRGKNANAIQWLYCLFCKSFLQNWN